MNALTLLSWLEPVGSRVLRISLEGAVIILVVVAVQKLLRRRLGPAWTFALWFVVLLRLSLPALPPSTLSWQPWLGVVAGGARIGVVTAPAPASAREPSASPSPGSPVTWTSGRSGAVDGLAVPSSPVSFPPLASGGEAKAAQASFAGWRWWLGLVWGLVALVLVLRFAVGMALFSRRLRRPGRSLDDPRIVEVVEACRREFGLRGNVSVQVTPEVSSPGVFGVWRPVILIPAELVGRLAGEEWRHIFRHELAHLRRRDGWWNAWSGLLACLHWFNPLVWWAAARMRRDRELACDDLALRGASALTRRSYGETLLKIASVPVDTRWNGVLVGIAEDARSLRERLGSLVEKPRRFRFQAVAVTKGSVPLIDNQLRVRDAVEDGTQVTGRVSGRDLPRHESWGSSGGYLPG